MSNIGQEVKLNTGKYKGQFSIFECWTDSHHLSSERRAQIRVQTGRGFKTILVNESNFEFKEQGNE